jgi:hypothetical protein
MPKRRTPPKLAHCAIVSGQQELLKWCPNVEGVSLKELERTCWACGAHGKERMTRCHIERYKPKEVERPDNFILLCDRCHREQPDALPKEALRYWLATRESETKRNERRMSIFNAAIALLKKKFGDFVVDVACGELVDDIRSKMERYAQNSAGQGSGNWWANAEWAGIAAIHDWCVANKERVELKFQEAQLAINAALEENKGVKDEPQTFLRSIDERTATRPPCPKTEDTQRALF